MIHNPCSSIFSPNLIMQTLIYKNSISRSPLLLQTSNCFFLQTYNSHDFLRIHPQIGFKTLTLRSAASPQSLSYGGWDDFQLTGDSLDSGKVNRFRNLLSSLGIADRKYVFVYLFGFVCALAMSRVKISTIMVFPASAIVFAVGFTVGLVKGGHLNELRFNGSEKILSDEALSGCIEKLKGYNARVLDVKDGIRRGIEGNQVTVSDLEGYIDVIESVGMSLRDTIDVVENCMHSILIGSQEKEGIADHDSGRRQEKSGENKFNFSQYINGLFGGKSDVVKSGKVEGAGKVDSVGAEVNNRKRSNILASPVEDRNLNSAVNINLESKNANIFDNPFDDSFSTARNRGHKFVDGDGMENIDVKDAEKNAKAVFDQTIFSYQNKTSRIVNNQQIHMKDYQEEIETMLSQNNSYDSVDVSISMNHIKNVAASHHQQKRETMNRKYMHLENSEEDPLDSGRYPFNKETFNSEKRPSFAYKESADENIFGSSPSSVLGDDMKFSKCFSEANDLLKEAKRCLTRKVDDGRAEHALRKSAMLLSEAIDMRPMSLLAVGQLGNTYLLHGEIKLIMTRDLRSLLVRADPSPVEERGKFGNMFDDQLANGDEMKSALVSACEECEELLIKAGRNYRTALSIDGNDMRALYNWGLALSFRAQLIADTGPSAASDADKIFMAAIDKFDAMMSKSNVYASDALFRWGAVLQHRSRLRPSRSRERAKLLQQARRLYEDAVQMDSANPQLQKALSSCMSELDNWYA